MALVLSIVPLAYGFPVSRSPGNRLFHIVNRPTQSLRLACKGRGIGMTNHAMIALAMFVGQLLTDMGYDLSSPKVRDNLAKALLETEGLADLSATQVASHVASVVGGNGDWWQP